MADAPRTSSRSETYWQIVRRQFVRNRLAVWAGRLVLLIFLVGTYAPVIASNVPFYFKAGGEPATFPWFASLFDRSWYETTVDLFYNLLMVVLPLALVTIWLVRRLVRPEDRVRAAWLVIAGLAILQGVGVLIVRQVDHRTPYVADRYHDLTVGEDPPARGLFAPVPHSHPTTSIAMALQPPLSRTWYQLSVDKPARPVGPRDKAVLQYCLAQAGDVERRIPRELRVEWRSLPARVRAYVLSRPPPEREELLGRTPDQWRSLKVTAADLGVSDAQLLGAGLVPGRTSLCGTDDQGRDILARMLFGVRISMSVGVIAVAIYVTIGVILGGLAGFFAGKTDILVQRLIEVMMCFPALILIMIIVGMRETRTIFLIMVVIGLTRWTGVARLTRGEYLRLRTQDFVVAAEALGVSNLKIIFRHILPNAIAPVLVSATFGVAGAILLEATLSFLGLGDLRSPSWGQILNLGRQNHQCQWLIWIPGLAIFLTVSALNFVGEAFRDAIDPKLRQ